MVEELNKFVNELIDGYSDNVFDAKEELERLDKLCRKSAEIITHYDESYNKLYEQVKYFDEDPFRVLNRININGHTENKNGLTYLSWAWAWQMLMELYPDSYTEINRPETGLPYWTDGKTCWVDVSVTVVWDDGYSAQMKKRTRSEVFPIMDHRNNSIPLDKVTSFNVNTALQRAWTKCIARHGLGFYIYAGEDLPKEEADAKAEQAKAKKTTETAQLAVQLTAVRSKLTELGVDLRSDSFVDFVKGQAKVETIEPGALLMDADGMQRVIAVMNAVVNAKTLKAKDEVQAQ